jgi:hypothetical protein
MNSLSHSRGEPRPVPTLQDVSVWFPGRYDGRRTQFRTTCVRLSFSKEDEKEWMEGLGRYAMIGNRNNAATEQQGIDQLLAKLDLVDPLRWSVTCEVQN